MVDVDRSSLDTVSPRTRFLFCATWPMGRPPSTRIEWTPAPKLVSLAEAVDQRMRRPAGSGAFLRRRPRFCSALCWRHAAHSPATSPIIGRSGPVACLRTYRHGRASPAMRNSSRTGGNRRRSIPRPQRRSLRLRPPIRPRFRRGPPPPSIGKRCRLPVRQRTTRLPRRAACISGCRQCAESGAVTPRRRATDRGNVRCRPAAPLPRR